MRRLALVWMMLLGACEGSGGQGTGCGDGKSGDGDVCYLPGEVREFSTSNSLVQAARTGDLDADGVTDVVISRGNLISVARGDGVGGLRDTEVFTPGDLERRPGVLTDLDGDGRDDVVVNGHGVDDGVFTLEILLTRGPADQLTFERTVVDPGAARINCVVAADINADAAVDLVLEVTDPAALPGQEGGLVVFPGNGDGTLGAAATYPLDLDGSGYVGLFVGDFDGDGLDDVVRNASTIVAVRYGAALDTSYDLGAVPGSLAVMDVNQDGVSDLVIVHDLQPAISLLLGSAGLGLGAPEVFVLPDPSKTLAFPADVDGDGVSELLSWRTNGESLEVLRVGTTGVESLGQIVVGPVDEVAVRVMTGELNGDGITDLLLAVDDDVPDDRLGLVLWVSDP